MSELPPFLETLRSQPLVFDGATGTALYERGVYLTKCFDELCLTQPELVREVHQDYVNVGVDVIQTNTYGANRVALAQYGIADKAQAICKAAVEIARDASQGRTWVIGSLGPSTLLPKDLIRNKTRRQAFDAFREQSEALVAAGCDALVFETFVYAAELEIAVEAAYGFDIPIIAQVGFNEALRTKDGADPKEVVQRLTDLNVDVMGANCVLGPEGLLEVVEQMVGNDRLIVMQPNAGHARTVDGRSIYQSSPETFGVVARRAFKKGVAAVGGCCGTSPAHMRRVVGSARMMGAGRWRQSDSVSGSSLAAKPISTPEPVVPFKERSRFARKLAAGEFVVSVEVAPPVGTDAEATLERIALLRGVATAVNIPDGPRATVRMSNIAMARLLIDRFGAPQTNSSKADDDQTLEPLVHFCARDRNLLALQGDLLGAHALGVKNLVLVTGDPPKVGDYPDATAVFDLDSPGLLSLASGLNAGKDPAGKSMLGHTAFALCTGAEPAAFDFDREIQRLREKKEAGAEVVMTQPVFDEAVFERFLSAIETFGLKVLVGVLPLASFKNAEFIRKHVPGMHIPDTVMARMQSAKSDRDSQQREGVTIAAEALARVKDRVAGAYVMPPFGRVEMALELLDRAL